MQKIFLGKKAIITGGSNGLGLKIASKFVLAGADVVICGRKNKNLESAKKHLLTNAIYGQKIISKVADISKKKDVDSIISTAQNRLGGFDVLVNNAAILGPKGLLEKNNIKDWMKTIEINLFGSVMMCQAAIKQFKKQGYGKIIQLSGGGAASPRPNFSAYSTSKTAVVRFCENLANELKSFKIDVNAIAPGALNTDMLQEVLKAGPDKVGEHEYKKSKKQKQNGGDSLDKASDLVLFLASPESNGITGKLISAKWDKWKVWPFHLKELKQTDIYTLRRVRGKDRNFKWGDV